MTISDLVSTHRQKAQELLADKSLAGNLDLADQRADQLVVANRHLFCCWALVEATEKDMARVAQFLTGVDFGQKVIKEPVKL